ncbi:MAG: SusC/RagA family TonB-linked outer membrane protein, partial [Muribaculaceae bacterium]
RSVYLPKTTLYGQKVNGQADIAQYDQNDYLLEFTASYNKQFADIHSLNAVAGYSFQKFNKEGVSAGNSDFLSDALLYNALSFGQYTKPWVGSSRSDDEMASFFGRVNYTLMGRYLLTATLRADGSSYFAKGHQWGYFPSVALGWRFSEENFMKDLRSWFSNGKLRLSWGQTGNSSIGYQAISLYKDRDHWGNRFNHGFGGTEYLGFQLTQLGNPEITWETTTEYNAGIDLGFFHNRLNLSVDYFSREISNLLNWRPLQHLSEVLSIADNMGKTRSHGLEITLNTTNIDNRDFSWTSDFTFSFYRDRWEERAEGWNPAAYEQYKGAIRSWQGFYVADGLVQPGEEIPYMPNAIAGQIKVKDINGYSYNADGTFKTDEHGLPILTGKPDGKINDADRVYLGSSDPGFILGFNNSFRYKDFDFNIYFYGHFNQWTTGSYYDMWLGSISSIDNGRNVPVSASEIWSTDNPTGWRPGYAQMYNTYDSGATTFYMKKCWFVRCRNITIGYNVPVKKGLSKLRIYADVTNPFMLTNYKGLDMETDANDSSWAYPNIRSYNFGVEITF